MTQDDLIKYSLSWLVDDEETGARWFQLLKEAFLQLYIMRIEKMRIHQNLWGSSGLEVGTGKSQFPLCNEGGETNGSVQAGPQL